MVTYYAVARGKKVGVFEDWNYVKTLVFGFRSPKYRKFERKEDAEAFIKQISEEDVGNIPRSVSASIRTSTEIGRNNDITNEPPDTLIAFCDGACKKNGSKNACGGYSSVWPFHDEFSGGWPLSGQATNNRAEFMGLIKTFEIATSIDPEYEKTLEVYTDSMFMINCITKWMPKWKSNGFKKSDGTEVLNQDLLVIVDEHLKKRKLDIKFVRAHTGKMDWISRNNARADVFAQTAARPPDITTFFPSSLVQ